MAPIKSKSITALAVLLVALSCFLFLFWANGSDKISPFHVGLQADGRIVVPTNQVLTPSGVQVVFPGRPVDMALAEEGRVLVVKNMADLVFIDVASARIKQTLKLPSKKAKEDPDPGFSVVGILVQGDRVYVSDTNSQVRIAVRKSEGSYQWDTGVGIIPPKVGAQPHPAGLAWASTSELWVGSSRGNTVQLLDLTTGQAQQAIPVGVAPYQVCCPREDRCYVTNWGGNPPGPTDPQSLSSGTPVRIDSRTRVANDGTVSILGPALGKWKQLKTIRVGLHPCAMTLSPAKRLLYVANANSDSVSVIDTQAEEVVETIACRPDAALPFGSGPNALALSPDGSTLYVANGTNNCLAVIKLALREVEGKLVKSAETSKLVGLIPTGWYPGAVLISPDAKKLFVANVKGHGSLSQPRPVAKGKNSHDHLGSVSLIDIPDAKQLEKYTEQVNQNNRLAYSLAGLEKPRPDVKRAVVPERHGETSVFKHVIYIIKENRTYDQIYGDIEEGNGDPNLVLFGEKVTPNHHALARQFTLFDNFYCSGILSADGHSWCDAAYVTDYLEKAFGGWTRSYPDDGKDALAFPATGFLWDNALAHKKSLRNYGEFVSEDDYVPKGTSWLDLYNDHKNGTRKVTITIKVNMASLVPYTHPTYPYFPLTAPDAYRADLFLEDLKQFEAKGQMPDLIYMSLPCDHTEGTRPGFPTPRAMVADNDLALGRIVEGVSKSSFWKDTCIFVVEDDPQNGFDHVDGHRTVALAISPYTKRKFVDSTPYNQTGMVKTIELLLGLPPMNQMDLSAMAMRNCFQDKPDLTPFTAVGNQVKFDEMNPDLNALKDKALFWAKKSIELNLDEADKADEDTLNHILWYAMRGYETPYPDKYAGKDEDDD
jgi:YVTN family beta-propeller protein